MPVWLRRILLTLLALILVIVIGAAIYIPIAARQSFPQTEGEIQVDGLNAPVDIYRDSAGIPHIYASNTHDLFFAQGYVHAQDRFWQMDFNRHVGAGRLSELMGSATFGTDTFLRTMGWERVARQELETLDPEYLVMLQSYADGINAYLADHAGTELSLEYLFLNLLNSGYEAQPWEPLNTLTWAKAMAWDLRDNMDTEIERAMLLANLPQDRIDEIFPPYNYEHPVMVPEFSLATSPESRTPSQPLAGLHAPLAALSEHVAGLDALLDVQVQESLGSNSWAVSGEWTASGAPLLANDPHLGASMPSIWYLVGLHCQPVGPDCPFEVSGVSFPGAPGVIIGHNQNIAWGFTNVGPDVMDLYIIKVNPANPNQYEMNGEWVDMEVVTESIQVAGGETVDMPVRITQFGPIITETYGLEEMHLSSGLELPDNYAFALRWTALEPGLIIQSVLEMDLASNWEEFRAAAAHFNVPAQNLVYADVEGNIGYQMPGSVPIRAAGNGEYPVPGWTDEYAWNGYIPFEELPHSFNPESGYIVSANNAVVDESYPYQITDRWDYGYRARRIVELLMEASGPIDRAYFEAMHADSVNLGALDVLPALMAVDLQDAELEEVRSLLESWNGEQEVDSAPAALFNAYWVQLLAATFHDELPEEYWPGGSSPWFATVDRLQDDPDNAWWDDIHTEEVEGRDDMIRRAFAAAVADLGGNPADWAWGDLHTITFEHEVMSNFPLINLLFNRGPWAVSGGSSIVNATNWDAASGTYDVSSLPSKRSIMDPSNWQNSLQITTTGQSGHAYHPHYIDMAPLWAAVDYLPMHWDLDAIQADAEGHLQLVP